ncbi:MAG: PIN domain-containing protein [Planctomycetaceae bacterium]
MRWRKVLREWSRSCLCSTQTSSFTTLSCLRNFEEPDVAVPITVLEELDRFKKGNEDINFQRERS